VETDLYQLYDFSDEAAAYAQPGDLVLDAGAGEGRYKPDFNHAHYVGVDLAVGDVAWDYSALDAIGNLERLPFATDTFDIALCQQVLEHVREPEQVLREITRVLKPGGKLFLSVPQSWCQHQKPHDYFRYTSFGLRYLFEKVGLETEEIRPMGGYFWFLAFQLHNLNYWLFPKGMRGRIFTFPLRLVFGIVFQLFIPLFLYYLDPLDRQKDETFGHLCIAVKSQGK
jgi:SAM-dependent methyltransferase